MNTSPASDDYATVRLTIREWEGVIRAIENQADREPTWDGEDLYRSLSRRLFLKVLQGPAA